MTETDLDRLRIYELLCDEKRDEFRALLQEGFDPWAPRNAVADSNVSFIAWLPTVTRWLSNCRGDVSVDEAATRMFQYGVAILSGFIHTAIQNGWVEVTRFIIKTHPTECHCKSEERFSRSPLERAFEGIWRPGLYSSTDTYMKIIRMLLENGARCDNLPRTGEAFRLPLICLIGRASADFSKEWIWLLMPKLVERGLDVNEGYAMDRSGTLRYYCDDLVFRNYRIVLPQILAIGVDPLISSKSRQLICGCTVVCNALSDDAAFHAEEFSPKCFYINGVCDSHRPITAGLQKDANRYRMKMIAPRITEICFALEVLELPAFVTLQIADAACGEIGAATSMHLKWDLITAIKHFRQRQVALLLAEQDASLAETDQCSHTRI